MAWWGFVGVSVIGLTKPNKELTRDLQGLAADFKWSAAELMRIAERLSLVGYWADAQAISKMITVPHASQDKLAGCADDVKAGRIVREKA